MKSVEQIEDRVRFLLREELQRRLAESQERMPRRCQHNHRQPLDSRRTVDGEPNPLFNRISRGVSEGRGLPVVDTLGLCMLKTTIDGVWAGTICEDDIDAQGCPYFQAKQTPEEVYRQFLEDLENEQWVVLNLPRIQPLLWVLGSRYERLDREPLPLALPWWKRVWLALKNQPASPRLLEGDPAPVRVYLPPPVEETFDVDANDNSSREDTGYREGTP